MAHLNCSTCALIGKRSRREMLLFKHQERSTFHWERLLPWAWQVEPWQVELRHVDMRACTCMFGCYLLCDLVCWLHREPPGLQSGRRAGGSGLDSGFRQTVSKQELRKAAEQRDNETEIRDQLTPTYGWVACLFTVYNFLFDTIVQTYGTCAVCSLSC